MAKKDPKKPGKSKPRKGTAKSVSVGRPLLFPDLEDLIMNIDAYFAFCDPHIVETDTPVPQKDGRYLIIPIPTMTAQRPYTMSGLAAFIGCDRSTLLDYEDLAIKQPEDIPLKLRAQDPEIIAEYSRTIKKARSRVETYVEERLMSGTPVGAIFNLKNNFARWEDKSVVENPAEAKYHKDVAELREQVVGGYKSKKKPKSV